MTFNKTHTTDKRVVRTKKAIRNALFSLMETKDIANISISELTTAANINRRTFYIHYKCTTDILNEIENEFVSALSELVMKIDVRDFKRSVYILFIDFNNLVTVDFAYYFRLMRLDARGMLVARLKKVLKNASELIIPSFHDPKNSNSNLASAFLSGGFIAFYIEWYYSENKIPLETAAEIVSALANCCVKANRP